MWPLPLRCAGVTLGVSAVYNYATHTPFAGFSVEATPGVSSAAGSNGLSINHSFLRNFLGDALRTRLDVVGSVALPGTRFNSITRKVGLSVRRNGAAVGWRRRSPPAAQGPIAFDLRALTVTATLR